MHKEVNMHNGTATLKFDLYGGAILAFYLRDHPINPLSFRFPVASMPRNNRNGAPYQGHFLCLGRWGQPSEGEIKAGIPYHGQLANMLWEEGKNDDKATYCMQATSVLEGLHVERFIQMEPESAAYLVKELVTNINPLGRFYNMVQHPSLAAPFLDETTVINCNAQKGFNSVFSKKPEQHWSNWPNGICEDGSTVNLSQPKKIHNGVFSFIVRKEDKYGWITAYSPSHQLLFGYVWLRKDYPWINLWQDWSENQIRYRGIEFGTAGIHKPFHQVIAENNTEVFGEKTVRFIDAGEKKARHYISFIQDVDAEFKAVEDIDIEDGNMIISGKSSELKINISSLIKSLEEL